MVRLLTLRELADEINAENPAAKMTPRILRRYCKMGMVYFPDTNCWRVRREAYDEFVREHEIKNSVSGAEAEA